MKRSRFSEEQIVGILKELAAALKVLVANRTLNNTALKDVLSNN